jgi:hypothetical protein
MREATLGIDTGSVADAHHGVYVNGLVHDPDAAVGELMFVATQERQHASAGIFRT